MHFSNKISSSSLNILGFFFFFFLIKDVAYIYKIQHIFISSYASKCEFQNALLNMNLSSLNNDN